MGRSVGTRTPAPVSLPATPPDALRALLASRPFRRMVLAAATSSLGDWLGFLAIIALTADIMGATRAAAFAVSGVMAARVLPSLLLAPIAGVLVDRWDRKRVLITTDVGRFAIMALIPFTQEVLALVLATLFLEVLSAMFAPAKDAVFPTLVRREQLVTANQINLGVTYGMLPFAGVLYAVLIALAERLAPAGSFLALRPVALPIWFNALSFLVSAALIASITIRSAAIPTRTASQSFSAQFREGLVFVSTHPVIRALIGGVMVAAAGAGVVITTGEFFADIVNAGPTGFGVLVAMVGVGMVLGLVVASPLSRRIRAELLFGPAIVVAGLGLSLLAAAPTLLVALPPSILMGAGAGVVFIVGYTVLQQRADDRIRGRAFGAFNAGVRVSVLGATIVVPFAIGLIGRESRTVIPVDGALTLIYPYVFGGIRLTLVSAGVFIMLGGVLSMRVLRRATRNGVTFAPNGETSDDASPLRDAPRGVFIVFEGGDGAGKSTQIRLLRDHLELLGLEVVVTREPGGTAIGERIREVLLDTASTELSDRAEALLYAAARAQHVAEAIVPALDAGKVVLCDRFIDSSIAYQGAGRNLGEWRIEELNLWATGRLVGDLIVLLDVAVDEGLRRAGGADGHDRLESAGTDFHDRVRAAYQRRAADEPHRYLLLDGRHSVEDIHARIVADVALALAPLAPLGVDS